MRALFLATIYLVPFAMLLRYVYFWAVYSFCTFFPHRCFWQTSGIRNIVILLSLLILWQKQDFTHILPSTVPPHFLLILVNGSVFGLRHITRHLPHVGGTVFVLRSPGAECIRKTCFNRQRTNSKWIGSMFQSDWTLLPKFKSAR